MPLEAIKLMIDIYWNAYSEFKNKIKNADKARELTNDFFSIVVSSIIKITDNTNTVEENKQNSDQFLNMLLNGGCNKDE